MLRFKQATDGVLHDHSLELRTPVHVEAGEEVGGVHVRDEVDGDGERISFISFGPSLTLRVPAGTFEQAVGQFILHNAPTYKRAGKRQKGR